MSVFAQPPTDPKANSYVDIDGANYILARRPYTEAWDSASQSPGARNYTVNDPGGALVPGDTTIPITGGLGDWTDGNVIQFGDPATSNPTYTVVGDFAEGAPSITIAAPGLTVPIPLNGVAVYRYTPNARESALIWATSTLDGQWDWFGSQTYATRGTVASGSPQQNLRWPRSGVENLDGYTFISSEYPQPLLELTAEFAMYLLQRDLAATPDVMGLGFSKAEIPGPLKVEVDSSETAAMVPAYLWNKYRMLGQASPGASPSNMTFLHLQRA